MLDTISPPRLDMSVRQTITTALHRDIIDTHHGIYCLAISNIATRALQHGHHIPKAEHQHTYAKMRQQPMSAKKGDKKGAKAEHCHKPPVTQIDIVAKEDAEGIGQKQ
jgi:hypothetical protein